MVAALRLIHIVAGAFWAGAAMLMGWIVIPTSKKVGPAAAPFMQGLIKNKLSVRLIASGILTVAAGLWLYVLRAPAFGRWQDYALALGALAAIVALTIGIALQRPTGDKLRQLGESMGGQPPNAEQAAELGRLQGRMASYGNVLAYLFALALAGMALSGS